MRSSPGQFKERDAHGCFNQADFVRIVTGDERGMNQGVISRHAPVV
jgi:hypothetical protein